MPSSFKSSGRTKIGHFPQTDIIVLGTTGIIEKKYDTAECWSPIIEPIGPSLLFNLILWWELK